MKTTKLITSTKRIFLLVLAILTFLVFQSCSTKAVFQKSSVVPAAEGTVNISKDKNDNYVIKMKISNLAEIDRLVPEKNGYVVWMEADRGSARNIGQINSSNNLNVTYETVATQEPKRVFITAEEDVNVQYPGSMIVLTTDYLKR